MVILGLGSNSGDRLGYLSVAVQKLSAVLGELRCSRILETAALLPKNAPADWNRPYLNMAVRGESALMPQALFAQVKTIERDIGRVPRGVWAPREIDIDILAMDDVVLDSADLAIPHRALLDRDFALLPFIELAPQWRYPVPGPYFQKSATEIALAKDFHLGVHLCHTGLTIHG